MHGFRKMPKPPLIQLLFGLSALIVYGASCGQVPAAENDRFGAVKLVSTLPGGREWFAHWDEERVVGSYADDSRDREFYNEEGNLRIGRGIASVPAGMTRLVVMTPTNVVDGKAIPLWTNVEMTVYVRRGVETRTLDYQAFYLSARSGLRHNDSAPCEGTSYHATARFDGQCGFKKEIWHTGGYTSLRPDPAPRPWNTVPKGKWIGMKYICRNCDGGAHVHLQLYLDVEENNQWKLEAEYTDRGGWRGEKPGCDRPQDYIVTEGRPAVYFRSDFVAVELKKFSVREIPAQADEKTAAEIRVK